MRALKLLAFLWIGAGLSLWAWADSDSYVDTHVHQESGSRLEVSLRLMDWLGVKKSILMPPPAIARTSGEDHVSLSEIALAYPDRFAFLAGGRSLNPMIQEALKQGQVTAELRRAFEEKARAIVRSGALGFGEMTAMHLSFMEGHPYEEAPPDHPLFLLLADLAAELDVVIDLHMEAVARDSALPERFSSPPNPKLLRENLSAFERLLVHNPKARIVWVHAGWDNLGFAAPSLFRTLLERHPNLYLSLKIDLQSPGRGLAQMCPLDEKGVLRPEWSQLLREFPDRFVIGTDSFYSMPPQARMMNQGPRSLLGQLPPGLARKVGCENAEKIYKL